MPKTDLATIQEACEILGFSYWSIVGLLKRGDLKKVKVGGRVFISYAHIEQFRRKLAEASKGNSGH